MAARILLVALVLVLAGCVRDRAAEIDDEVRSIASSLESPEWRTRCDAERRLIELGPDAAPALERERREAHSEEARRRLYYALARTVPLRWLGSLTEALAEARRTGKPILNIEAAGPPEIPWSVADSAFCRIALVDRDFRHELARNFVLVWPAGQRPWATSTHIPGPMPNPDSLLSGVLEAGGDTWLVFATPEGEIRHMSPGSLRPDRMRAELARARALLAAPTTEEARRLRAEMADELEREAGGARRNHDIDLCREPDCIVRRLARHYVSTGHFGKPLVEPPSDDPFGEK